MIITDLHKQSQPIIRYELNDLVTLSKDKCACGSNFRLIQAVQGRRDDMLWAKRLDGAGWQFILPDYICRAIITSSDNITDYQVTQLSPEQIEARIIIKDTGSEQTERSNVIRAIESVFARLNCQKPVVKVIYAAAKANKNSQKLVRVIRKYNIEDYKPGGTDA